MATTTTKYGFVKPQLTDAADITATNGNWDKIEIELNTLNTVTTELNDNVTNLNTSLSNQNTSLNNKINTEVAKLQSKITFGVNAPSGGSNGDVYIQLITE